MQLSTPRQRKNQSTSWEAKEHSPERKSNTQDVSGEPFSSHDGERGLDNFYQPSVPNFVFKKADQAIGKKRNPDE